MKPDIEHRKRGFMTMVYIGIGLGVFLIVAMLRERGRTPR